MYLFQVQCKRGPAQAQVQAIEYDLDGYPLDGARRNVVALTFQDAAAWAAGQGLEIISISQRHSVDIAPIQEAK